MAHPVLEVLDTDVVDVADGYGEDQEFILYLNMGKLDPGERLASVVYLHLLAR